GPEPAALSISGLPASVDAGACSGAVRVQVVDGSGNKAVVRAATVVALSASPDTGVTFYSDEACSRPTSTVTITPGVDSAPFAFKSTTVGTLNITATVPDWVAGTGAVDIARGTGDGLAFTTPAQNLVAGACSAPVT